MYNIIHTKLWSQAGRRAEAAAWAASTAAWVIDTCLYDFKYQLYNKHEIGNITNNLVSCVRKHNHNYTYYTNG